MSQLDDHRPMNTYVMLTTLTSEGARTLWDKPRRVRDVNEEIEEYGCRVVSQFATMGPYDFLTILEAPDHATVMRLSAMMGSRGTVRVLSMPAVWVGEFLDSLPAGARDGAEAEDEGG